MKKEMEKNNLEEIKRLNQRGGKMLSIIDLVERKTLSLDMAAFLFKKMYGENPSLLTSALKSGTGKTTLMASLLNLIKPGIKIQSIEKIPESEPKVRYLVHEIGSGPYYSYLWGEKARNFFSLPNIATCIHSSSLKEIKEKMKRLDVREDFENLKLILIMKKLDRRRVTEVYYKSKLIFNWNKEKKEFKNLGVKIDKEYKNLIKKLISTNIRSLKEIRKEVLKL